MRAAALALLLFSCRAFGLSPAAKEFMEITNELQPVQCEKQKLRRAIALAQVEQRAPDERELKKRFSAINRDPRTAKLEKRLAQLEPRLEKSGDPEDLAAINRQRVEAFYRCE